MDRLPKNLRRLVDKQSLMHMSVPPLKDDMEYEYVEKATGQHVQAMQLTPDTVTIVSMWSNGMPVMEHDALDHSRTFVGLNVPTNSDPKRASEGDYVVKLADGSFSVRKSYELEPVREE